MLMSAQLSTNQEPEVLELSEVDDIDIVLKLGCICMQVLGLY